MASEEWRRASWVVVNGEGYIHADTLVAWSEDRSTVKLTWPKLKDRDYSVEVDAASPLGVAARDR